MDPVTMVLPVFEAAVVEEFRFHHIFEIIMPHCEMEESGIS